MALLVENHEYMAIIRELNINLNSPKRRRRVGNINETGQVSLKKNTLIIQSIHDFKSSRVDEDDSQLLNWYAVISPL